MKILYLDTSSSFLYMGIVSEDKLLISVSEKLDKDLSSLALVKIEEMFKKVDLAPADIDKILVVSGPGSFTGIRVGLTIAKVFAWSLNKKISTISSLEAMSVINMEYDYIIPLIDARRDYIYSAIYDKIGGTVLSEQYLSINALLVASSNLPGRVIFVSNDSFSNISNVVEYKPNILDIVIKFKDKKELNPHEIDAYYLKLTEAEENKRD